MKVDTNFSLLFWSKGRADFLCIFLGGWGQFASCHFSVTKISDAFLERWVLFIRNFENDLILISLMSEIFLWWQHHFSFDETKSLPLNVSFPDRDILPTTAFRAKRKCSKLQFVEALSRFGGSANSCSHAARCLYFGGWQACSSRKSNYLSNQM